MGGFVQNLVAVILLRIDLAAADERRRDAGVVEEVAIERLCNGMDL